MLLTSQSSATFHAAKGQCLNFINVLKPFRMKKRRGRGEGKKKRKKCRRRKDEGH
jgi:hypothetical protein